ncbi:hypothetical protein JTE90_021902 [Oedothorax gibbosus]|uniref:Uncharacterized protein n=1 Tax=Oedothorax gibbosus TaxID=931172 RepID=A0AAV6VTI2_9ARAC|nr:hypothetical protein JTE90_021902 [Oedothorax gibbosus]
MVFKSLSIRSTTDFVCRPKMVRSRNLKLTVVGDKGVGKTSLLKTYAKGSFPGGEYVSTVFPFLPDEEYVYSRSIDYSGQPVLLAMWDRVYFNQKEDDDIRAVQFYQTDVFLLCFSVIDQRSFSNILQIWKPEILKHCPKSKCLLVGLKKDLRCAKNKSDPSQSVITRSMGRDMAERIGAVDYMECSAKTKDGIKQVYAVAIQSAMGNPPHKQKKLVKCGGCRLYRLARLL